MPNEVILELSLTTRRRLSVELAQRIWPDAEINWTLTGGVCIIPAGTIVEWRTFDPFTNHEDAQALARWVAGDFVIADKFERELQAISVADFPNGCVPFWSGLLATPAQITMAACRALNLSLEDNE